MPIGRRRLELHPDSILGFGSSRNLVAAFQQQLVIDRFLSPWL